MKLMSGENFHLNDGGGEMNKILDEAKEYVENLPIYRGKKGEIRRGLFFLGYIMAQIGEKQKKKGLNETIVNKLNFRGMNKNQVLRLFNQVVEYMRIYGLQDFPENSELIGEVTTIFDKNLNNWGLLPEETVYFILSGYAFLVSKLIEKKREKSIKEVDNE